MADHEPSIYGSTHPENARAFDMVDLRALTEAGVTGKGVSIAVVDPNIGDDGLGTRYIPRRPGEEKPRIHGVGISSLVSEILPASTTNLLGVRDPKDIPGKINRALDSGANAINLSFAYPSTPSEEIIDKAYEYACMYLRGANTDRQQYMQSISDAENWRAETNEVNIMRTFLKRAIDRADEQGTVIVAATKYELPSRQLTFEVYPQIIMVGALAIDGTPIDSPSDARIDIYAPADGLVVGSSKTNPHRKQKIYGVSHSFATPFVTAACAIASKQLGNAAEARQAVIDTASDQNGIKVVNFRNLLSHLGI